MYCTGKRSVFDMCRMYCTGFYSHSTSHTGSRPWCGSARMAGSPPICASSATLSLLVQAVVHCGPLSKVIWRSHSPALRQCRHVPLEPSIYDVHKKNQILDPPSPVHMGQTPPPLWTSTRGQHEIHTALVKKKIKKKNRATKPQQKIT